MIRVKGFFLADTNTGKNGPTGTFRIPVAALQYIEEREGKEEGKKGRKYQATIYFLAEECKINAYPYCFRVEEFLD